MRVCDLGRLSVETDTGIERISGAKQVAILSLLAAHPNQRVSVDTLIEAGWGDDARTPVSAIENQVWRLRKILDPHRSRITNDAGGYRLDAASDEVDSSRFRDLVESVREATRDGHWTEVRGRADEALRLWRGPPYEPVAHVAAIQPLIAQLDELHVQVAEQRVDALLATGEAERVVADLGELTGRYPYRERLWAQLMTALSRTGRNQAALQVYQQVRSLLLDELGLEPGAELRALQHAIIAQDDQVPHPSPPPRAATSPPPPFNNPTPIIGRAHELAAVAAARQQGAPGVLLHGAAGVGKSRLLREALAEAEQDGAHVVRVLATRSAAAIPLGAFTDLVPVGAPAGGMLAMLQRSAQALTERAARRPLALGVDDAQLLDPASAALVLHMATSGGAFVIATVRAGDARPDAITSLTKDIGALRLDLEPLDEDDSAALAEQTLRGRVERRVARWLYEVSLGNPLYLVEMARSARADATLVEVDGAWRRADPDDRMWVAPPLAELVEDSLVDLPRGQRHVLEVLALGEPLLLRALVSLAGVDDVLAVEDRGLITVDGTSESSNVVLAHPLHAAVVRAGLPALRARETKRELIRIADSGADLLRVTCWRLDIDEPVPVDTLQEAAQLAVGAGDALLTSDLALRAKAAGATVDADLILAQAYIAQRDYSAASMVLVAAEPNLRTQEQAAAYLHDQNEVLYWGLRLPGRLLALLDRAARWFPEPEWQHQVEQMRQWQASFLQLADPHIRPGAHELGVAQVANLFYSGRTSAARELSHRLRPDPPVRSLDSAIALSLWARVELETGADWADAQDWLRDALDRAEHRDDPASAGQICYSLAEFALGTGEPGRAATLLTESRRQLARRDPVALLPVVAATAVVAAHFNDDSASVEYWFDTYRSQLDGTAPLPHQLPYTARAEAWAAFHRGDRAAAQRVLLDATERLAGSPVHVARMSYEAMRVGAAAHNLIPTLETMNNRCDAALVACYLEHARARAADDDTRLQQVSERFERLGARQYASEAASHAIEARARR